MSKLSALSAKDIHDAIKAMQNGIAIKPDGDEAKSLQRSIDRALEELQRRNEQKKSDDPESPIRFGAMVNPSLGIPYLNQIQQKEMDDWSEHIEQVQKAKMVLSSNNQEDKIIINASAYAPEPNQSEIVVSIWLNRKIDGKITQVQEDFTPRKLQDYMQTYFVRIRDSEALRAGNTKKIHSGLMFPNLVGCVLGWIEYRGSFPESVILTGRKKMNKEEFARAAILMSLIRYSIEK